MTGFEIKFEDDELNRVLARVGAALGDMEPVNAQIGELMVEKTKARFDSGKGPDGVIWAPRTETTITRYLRLGFTPGPIPLTGQSKALRTQIFYEARAEDVSWGSSMIQSAVMQFGAGKGQFGQTSRGDPIPWGDIPARPYIGFSEDDRSDVIGLFEEWLKDAAGE